MPAEAIVEGRSGRAGVAPVSGAAAATCCTGIAGGAACTAPCRSQGFGGEACMLTSARCGGGCKACVRPSARAARASGCRCSRHEWRWATFTFFFSHFSLSPRPYTTLEGIEDLVGHSRTASGELGFSMAPQLLVHVKDGSSASSIHIQRQSAFHKFVAQFKSSPRHACDIRAFLELRGPDEPEILPPARYRLFSIRRARRDTVIARSTTWISTSFIAQVLTELVGPPCCTRGSDSESHVAGAGQV